MSMSACQAAGFGTACFMLVMESGLLVTELQLMTSASWSARIMHAMEGGEGGCGMAAAAQAARLSGAESSLHDGTSFKCAMPV